MVKPNIYEVKMSDVKGSDRVGSKLCRGELLIKLKLKLNRRK